MISIIRYLPIKTIENDLLQYSLDKGSVTKDEKDRIFCCRLLSPISNRIHSNYYTTLIMEKVNDLCKDCSDNVRRTMIEEIYKIAVPNNYINKQELSFSV